jgi:hypothetical protein
VAQLEHITVDDEDSYVRIDFTPTIPHCSMATLIGLCIRVKLLRSLPERFKVDVNVREGTHQSEKAGKYNLGNERLTILLANIVTFVVNKQLNDKERVAAALENNNLLEVVNQCLSSSATTA